MAKKKEALARALGTLEYTLGFEIMNFLKDKDVNEIIVNPDTRIWVDTFSRGRVLTEFVAASRKGSYLSSYARDYIELVRQLHRLDSAAKPKP